MLVHNQNKALLISDISELLELQEKALIDRGIQLFTASSEKEALEINSREDINLVICGLEDDFNRIRQILQQHQERP